MMLSISDMHEPVHPNCGWSIWISVENWLISLNPHDIVARGLGGLNQFSDEIQMRGDEIPGIPVFIDSWMDRAEGDKNWILGEKIKQNTKKKMDTYEMIWETAIGLRQVFVWWNYGLQ